MGKHKGRSGGRWRTTTAAYRAWCESKGRVCALCNRPIDYSLRKPDPWAFSVDHIIPVSKLPANDPLLESWSNFQPAHQSCNSRRGNGDRTPKKAPRVVPKRLW